MTKAGEGSIRKFLESSPFMSSTPKNSPPTVPSAHHSRRAQYAFSITRKIWLCLSLLLLGYSGTMLFGFVRGSETRELLMGHADQGFPAAVESQAALTAFKEQLALYSEAVMMGELECLDEADDCSSQAQAAMRRLQQPMDPEDPRWIQAELFIKRMTAFTESATPHYKAMASSMDAEGLDTQAEKLANQYTKLEEDLTAFKNSVSDWVRSGLHDLSLATEREWNTNFIIFLTVVLGAFGLASMIIHRWISSPLRQAAEFARKMAAGDLSQKLDMPQNDEIGELARAFNTMATEIERSQNELEEKVVERTMELEAAHKELMVTAKMAGMAEVASSVLHNVGNVLNSVNVTTESLRNRVKKSKVGKLSGVCDLLNENQSDLHHFFESDPRGSKLVPYVIKLSEHLADDRGTQLEMLDSLHGHVEHITSIISQQQSNSRAERITEDVDVVELIEDSLDLAGLNVGVQGLNVTKEYEDDLPVAKADRHKTLQVLVNLLNNAFQAVQDGDSTDPMVHISVRTEGTDGVAVSVKDNGVGISEENMQSMFKHGFTTKEDGHGYGLHSSILAAKEMRGTLVVASEGVGQGATFTLTLPSSITEGSDA